MAVGQKHGGADDIRGFGQTPLLGTQKHILLVQGWDGAWHLDFFTIMQFSHTVAHLTRPIIQLTCLQRVYTTKISFSKMLSAYCMCSNCPYNIGFVELILAAEMLMLGELDTVKSFLHF